MMLKLFQMVNENRTPPVENANTNGNKPPKRRKVTVHDLSDDEEEIEFDDDPKAKKQKTDPKKMQNSSSGNSEGGLDEELTSFTDGLDQTSETEQEDMDTFMQDLQQFFETGDSTGPDLEEKMATVVNSSLRVSVGEQKINDLCDKLLRPKNCEGLIVPKVNQEIWARLQRFTRNRDLAMQKIQLYLAKAMIPMLRMMQEMREVIKTNKTSRPVTVHPSQWLTMASESFRVMALGFVKITNQRKDMIKPDLSDNYKQLCSDQNQVTSLLFGDDLSKKIKEIEDSERVGHRVSQQVRREIGYDGHTTGKKSFAQRSNYKGDSKPAGSKKNHFLGHKPSHQRQNYPRKF